MENPKACGHPSCGCTISDTSPDPFCCDLCREHVNRRGRCDCGHEACGGAPGHLEANAPSALNAERIGNPESRE
ncbi:MAG TPA: hypothetical protein VKT51_02650 [Candidatus Eremiobacteraceae bacterium]|nr:hypothetical protein [Candidatus Eremiobacteraceae bacterium]